jgi:hypothetical protein
MAETETNGDSTDRLPQPTEEVHLPDPSYLPVLVAFSVLLILVGIVNLWPVAAIGGLILVLTVARWIRLAREEMRQLPL